MQNHNSSLGDFCSTEPATITIDAVGSLDSVATIIGRHSYPRDDAGSSSIRVSVGLCGPLLRMDPWARSRRSAASAAARESYDDLPEESVANSAQNGGPDLDSSRIADDSSLAVAGSNEMSGSGGRRRCNELPVSACSS